MDARAVPDCETIRILSLADAGDISSIRSKTIARMPSPSGNGGIVGAEEGGLRVLPAEKRLR
jgi:hypothetical protein